MLKLNLLIVLGVLISDGYINGNPTVFFRRDYKLYSEVGTFYKLNKSPKSWNEARKHCILESASLAVPKTAVEAEIYKKVMAENPGSFFDMYIGVQAFSKGLFTALDGTPIEDLYHGWSSNQPDDSNQNENCVQFNRQAGLNDINCEVKFPFICEKKQDNVEWNNDCQVPDPGYRRLDGMDHCYKLHLKPKNWGDAYAVCIAEQSYLAILNSEEESKALAELYKSETTGKANVGSGVLHLGFHDRYKEGEFNTIEGTTLTGAGFNVWGNGQPDHPAEETCGAMSPDGKLDNIKCDLQSYFVCEHEDDSGLSIRRKG